MNLTQSRKDFWIHLNPVGEENFMVHGRTYSEPKLDKQLGRYVLTDEGRMSNDRLTCVNCTAKSFLPEALWKSVAPGMRAHVYNYTFWELKNENDEVMPVIAQKTDYQPDTYFEMQQFSDHLVFGLRGKAELHERYSSFNTRQDDPENPLKVQFVNKYGQVVTHGCVNLTDAYIMIGSPGDVVKPADIASLWGSDFTTQRKLDTMLIEAYLLGIRYLEPPEDDVIHMDVKLLGNERIQIIPKSDYYGFAEGMVFNSKKDFRSDVNFGYRSLDRCIINAVVSYRWFFNKPSLNVSLSLVHNARLEKDSTWEDKKEYEKYMARVAKYEEADLGALAERINSKINQKSVKYKETPYFTPADYINSDFFEKNMSQVDE